MERMLVPFFNDVRNVDPWFGSHHSVWDLVPPSPLRYLARDLDRQLSRLDTEALQSLSKFPIEGAEVKNNEFKFNIDLSGFKPEDIKMTFDNGKLAIHAKMDKKEGGNQLKQEILREFTLPKNIDKASLKSSIKENGVLTVEAKMVKPVEEKKPVQIPIEMKK